MGGNLFKRPRIPRERYQQIVDALTPVLQSEFGENYRIPKSYFNKPDYGDLDILVNISAVADRDWRQGLIKRLNLTEYKKQQRLFSTVYENFQVDYFALNGEDFESTYNFMSFNILGNLLGRIFHKFGLKYGEHGLSYPLRNYHGVLTTEVMLSKDMREILGFLELDYSVWQKGFADLVEIFRYVVDCKYFSPLAHKRETGANNQRKKHRREYKEFLLYLSEQQIDKGFQFGNDKTAYIAMIDAYFHNTDLARKVAEHNNREEINRQVNEKFNGRILLSILPQLSGNQIGLFIKQFKSSFEDFESFILQNDQITIEESIRKFILYNNEE